MTTKKHKLPSKLSDVLAIAILDMSKVVKLRDKAIAGRKTSPYRIDMGLWHVMVPNWTEYGRSGSNPFARCSVCFAGSVMAGSLKVPQNVDTSPENLLDEGAITARDLLRLHALDKLRRFDVFGALTVFDVERRTVGRNIEKKMAIEKDVLAELGFKDARKAASLVNRINSTESLAKPEGAREFLQWMRKLRRALAKRGL
ncbi:MAG: hypothetical protein ING19_08175 [Azospirillum sp.]|nr:hypothetical protein [Azospirillum sp.]